MKIEHASLSDKGKVRENNEDACGQFVPAEKDEQAQKGILFLVADGMGGHRGGEIASRLAVEAIVSAFTQSQETDRAGVLVSAFEHANTLILTESTTDTTLFGMGTTCTAIALHGSHAYFAHVGDSRAYCQRGDQLTQMTNDHSLVGEMVRSGIITDEDARTHPRRNVITRSLGIQESLMTDTPNSPFEVMAGDTFLLCSDGLTSFVEDDEIARVLAGNDVDSQCETLVRLANDGGGKDNITVQVIRIVEV